MKTMLYVCPVCGNVVMKLVDSGVAPYCCGREMQLLRPELREDPGMSEKHLPDVSLIDETKLRAQVGTESHPMSREHHIPFVLFEGDSSVQVHFLSENDLPVAKFYCGFDRPRGIYSWCNRHGLWGTINLPLTINS